jgi:hypothetical protein
MRLLVLTHETSFYAKDPIGEVFAVVLFILGTGLGCNRYHELGRNMVMIKTCHICS